MKQALAIALLLPALAMAQYKWLDADGRVNYGDNPPREARNIERVNAPKSEAPAAAAAGLPYEVRRAAEAFPVTLYTTPNCGACQQARDLLSKRGVPFSEVTISSAEEAQEAMKRGLGDSAPVVTIGRQTVREPDFAAWERALDFAGYPRTPLPRGWQNPAPRPLLERPAAKPAPVG